MAKRTNPRLHYEVAHYDALDRKFSTRGAANIVAFRIADKHQTPIWIMKIDSHGEAFHVATIHPKKNKNNPRGAFLFRTRAAALKYAREHGAKRFSIRNVKAGR